MTSDTRRADPWTRPDARAFLEEVLGRSGSGELFDTTVPVVMARAPGRLDVMGGIADYSGSLVLQWPIAEATFVALQATEDERIRVISLGEGSGEPERKAEIDRDELFRLVGQGYQVVGARFAGEDDHWVAYILGTLAVLMIEGGAKLEGGLRLLIGSQIPEGKGVSSSAALEVATMASLAELWGLSIRGEEMARLCQLAENRVVGAPCGIMDQMTAAMGREGRLLALLCQPARVLDSVQVPEGVRFWGIDSGIRHAVSGSDYTSVRTAAFMGYRILAEEAGLVAVAASEAGHVAIDDHQWQGYLANVGVSEYESRFTAAIPESINGTDFLSRYGGITDTVTHVEPLQTYTVRAATEHPVREHERVVRFAELLSAPIGKRGMQEMGELMYASHASYSACGLGSDGTDRLVELVKEQGEAAGLYGAKITGGGSGGTVAVLGRAAAAAAVKAIALQYADETGRAPVVFSGSSPGAVRFGTRWWTPDLEPSTRDRDDVG